MTIDLDGVDAPSACALETEPQAADAGEQVDEPEFARGPGPVRAIESWPCLPPPVGWDQGRDHPRLDMSALLSHGCIEQAKTLTG